MRWPWSKPHQWSDWIVTDRGAMLYWQRPVGTYLTQERYCTKCGKTEVSEYATYGGHSPASCDRHSTMPPRTPRKDKVTS